MTLRSVLFLLAFTTVFTAFSQDKTLPYYEIPDAPNSYTATSVAARMIDGLGFRYYWATQGLRAEDLAYKPSESGRTSAETIDHIYGLSKVIVNATIDLAKSLEYKLIVINYQVIFILKYLYLILDRIVKHKISSPTVDTIRIHDKQVMLKYLT